jgi:hypothetical protein
MIEFFPPLFRASGPTKQFSGATKPFWAFAQISGNSGWLSSLQRTRTGESEMRTISFILAFVLLLAGPSMAG